MTDRKFSLLRKEQQWVLCCGKDIIWLVGERTDNRFRVDSSTQRVLIIHIIKKKR
ncbi:tRNA(Ile)-lysidine synthase [Bacteroides eggerthii CAG:109]|jgi:tRNA(Ile)-lysidine synthase|nr:tRNA(Ile)-lysidine synthase [Bacteroides eggerthii CAG:109]